jgi:hypothetical protein
MVKTIDSKRRVNLLGYGMFVLAFFLVSYFGMTVNAYPKGIEGASTVLDEERTIELNNVGDAHVTDVLKYDKTWFNSYEYIFEKYPFLLTRQSQTENNLREKENFESNIDKTNYSITLTYDEPGYAYNMGDSWVLLDFPEKPKFDKGGQFVYEGEGTEVSAFTLWDTMHINYTTIVEPPAGATNAGYDQSQKGLAYQLPYVAAGASSNPLANNKALFIALFVILMIVSLGGAVFFLTRKAGVAPAVAGSPFTPGAPTAPEGMAPPPITTPTTASPTPPTVAPAAMVVTQTMAPQVPTEEPSTQKEAAATEEERGSKFCKFCGSHLKHAGAKFCSGCGKEQV